MSGVQLLDKTRKISKLLHNNSSSKVVFNDICKVMREILNSNVLVISRKGKVLGTGRAEGIGCIGELMEESVGGFIDSLLNERLLGVLSTKENVNLEALGFEEPDIRKFQAIITPIEIAGERLGTLFAYKCDSQYDIDDIILCEYGTTVVGLEMLRAVNEESAEVGLSGGRISDTPLEQKLLEDRWFMEGTLPDYRFTSFYSTQGHTLEVELQDRLLESVRTVVSQYGGELDVFGYLNENVTRQALLADGVHYTYGQDFLAKCVETALGYTSVMVDMEWIAYPDSGDALNEMSSNLGWNLQNYFKGYENFEGTTVSESDERIRAFLALDYGKRIDGNTVYLELENPGSPAWFVLRGEGKRIRAVEGGQWTLLEDGAYLIEATEENVVITLQNSTRG